MKVKSFAKLGIILGMVSALCILSVGNFNRGPSLDGIRLAQPALAQEEVKAFPKEAAGISGYVKLAQSIDLNKAAKVFERIEDVSKSHIIGTVPIESFVGIVRPHLYVDVAGWVVAYFLSSEPASLIMQWSGDTDNPVPTIKTTLEEAVKKLCATIEVGYAGDIQYYNFKYPEADGIVLLLRILPTPGSKVSYVKVPGNYTLYEVSYYHYGNNFYQEGINRWGYTSELKIDGNVVNRLSRSWASGIDITTAEYSKKLFALDKLHEIEITYYPQEERDRGSAGVAIVLIYKSK